MGMTRCSPAGKRAAFTFLAAVLLLEWVDAQAVGPAGYRQSYAEGEQLDIYVYASTKTDPYLSQGKMFNATASPNALIYKNSTKFGWNIVTGKCLL